MKDVFAAPQKRLGKSLMQKNAQQCFKFGWQYSFSVFRVIPTYSFFKFWLRPPEKEKPGMIRLHTPSQAGLRCDLGITQAEI